MRVGEEDVVVISVLRKRLDYVPKWPGNLD